ncbi:MAG TPA: helix-turn-helix transcriptional regulator [Candidatus Bacteroides merdipullorum]|uniref:Helix-turn-helix transcriptional regulator n=1 Tax=Candidatus Bacteroides merdipullorum TaxID=2838474 RepID=A0A9D2A3Z2_9BACE|nr:helix-turn-helix transcriptional regulator [Candidatus Bacteroides merdipullorum]
MENLQETITDWLRSGQTAEGQLEIATYGNSLLMAQATGMDFRLHNDWPPQQWHVFLHVHEGELRLTANGDRIGFDAPVYVDFLSNARWTDVTFVGRYRACFVLVEQQFFMESTQQMRSKVIEGMMRFAQSPFTPMDESENKRLQQLEEAMMATLRDGRSVFVRELLQTMACAWQYELWNIFFRRLQTSRTEIKSHWGDTAAQFFYLAHTHCRERHEVGWYARQVGLSSDALSAVLKRFCGKSANTILTELLTEEAKVCLRNPSLSVQEVAEMLHFADQSAFGKFFKRQCGVSPMQYKKETEQPG